MNNTTIRVLLSLDSLGHEKFWPFNNGLLSSIRTLKEKGLLTESKPGSLVCKITPAGQQLCSELRTHFSQFKSNQSS